MKWKDVKITLKKMWNARHPWVYLVDDAVMDTTAEEAYNDGYAKGAAKATAELRAKMPEPEPTKSRMAAKSKRYLDAMATMAENIHLQNIVRTYFWNRHWKNDGKMPIWCRGEWDYKEQQWKDLVHNKTKWNMYLASNGLKVEFITGTWNGRLRRDGYTEQDASASARKAIAAVLPKDRTLVKNISWAVVDTKKNGQRIIEAVCLTKRKEKKTNAKR